MKYAALMFIKHPDELLYLGLKKHGKDDWGFPGGKVEPGEKVDAAAIRELKEETTLEILPNDKVVFVFATDAKEFLVSTFRLETDRKKFNFENSKEGTVDWVSREQLETGTYGEYNKKLFNLLENK